MEERENETEKDDGVEYGETEGTRTLEDQLQKWLKRRKENTKSADA